MGEFKKAKAVCWLIVTKCAYHQLNALSSLSISILPCCKKKGIYLV